MANNKKIYWVFIILLNIIIGLFIVFNIINWKLIDIFIDLFILASGLWFLSVICLIFHIKKVFDWFYKIISPIVNDATPEFFSTSQYLLPKERVKKRIQLTTLILLGLSIVCQLILLFIK